MAEFVSIAIESNTSTGEEARTNEEEEEEDTFVASLYENQFMAMGICVLLVVIAIVAVMVFVFDLHKTEECIVFGPVLVFLFVSVAF